MSGRPSVYHLPKVIDAVPRSLKRSRSAHGFLSQWRNLRDAMWGPGHTVPYSRLPQFVVLWGKNLYDTSERDAYDAIRRGDVVFFEAWITRLSMMDAAAATRGLTLKERGTLIYAIGAVQGYRDVARRRLLALGWTD